MKKLCELSLESCPLTKEENYRNEIFKLIPQLEVVDSKDKSGNTIEDVINDDEDIVIEEEDLEEFDEHGSSDSEGEKGKLDIGKRGLPGDEQAEHDSDESDSEEEGI